MPNTIGATLPGTLLAQIEVATLTAAAAAFAKNPPAARAILQAAALALFTPPIGPALVTAVGLAVAAYCLSQWGADSAQPTQSDFTNNTGGWLTVRSSLTPTTNFLALPPGCNFRLNKETSGYPTLRYLSVQQASGTCLSPPQNQAYFINNNNASFLFFPRDCATGTSGTQLPSTTFPTNLPYNDLTDDDKLLLANVSTVTLPRTIPKLPLPENDPTKVIPPLIGKVGTDVLDCCLEQQTQWTADNVKLDLILARVRRACINIGLPDLDGSNTGVIEGQDEDFYYTLSSAVQELLRALGPWPSTATTRFNSDDVAYSSVRRGLDTVKDRLNYDELEETPTPTDENQTAGDVQEHIRYTKWEGQDASFHTGYADTAPARNHLKIIFTDTTQYRNKQQASMQVPNPKPNLTNSQIKDAIPVRVLGSYWCTLLLADKTKLVGWFPSSTVGQTQLTDLAALTVSGISNPVRFTTTLKAYGTPAIAGTSLTPTGYSYNRLNSDGTFTLITERI